MTDSTGAVNKIKRPQVKIAPLSKHDFVRMDNPDGGHRDRVCVVCGLGDSNPVHV